MTTDIGYCELFLRHCGSYYSDDDLLCFGDSANGLICVPMSVQYSWKYWHGTKFGGWQNYPGVAKFYYAYI